jgi:hypothetical protein
MQMQVCNVVQKDDSSARFLAGMAAPADRVLDSTIEPHRATGRHHQIAAAVLSA